MKTGGELAENTLQAKISAMQYTRNKEVVQYGHLKVPSMIFGFLERLAWLDYSVWIPSVSEVCNDSANFTYCHSLIVSVCP